MAGIDVKNFVNVNIQTKAVTPLVGTRQTVILFTGEGTSSTVNVVTADDYAATYTTTLFPVTKAYLDMYFANGGAKCKVIEGVGYSAITQTMLGNLEKEEIIVVCAIADTNREAGYAAMKTLASGYTGTGVAQKIFLARTYAANNDSIPYFGAKYSSILGAEMTIAAYLSRIDVYGTDTVNDYSFTVESITKENITNDVFVDLMAKNENVDIDLAGATRNIGGNLTNGQDIVNTYTLIILHQTVTNQLLNVLSSKIKNARGLSQIYSSLAQELENYRTCGYLTTDKIYNYDTYQVIYNNVSYTIIEKGTPLVSGYFIKVLPLSALSDADKALRKAPPVYVILADQYGIRKIEITGEVI